MKHIKIKFSTVLNEVLSNIFTSYPVVYPIPEVQENLLLSTQILENIIIKNNCILI